MRLLHIQFFALALVLILTVRVEAQQTRKLSLDKIVLPKGFKIDVFADNVPGARSMTLSPSGILYVGTRDPRGSVYAVVDTNKDGKADQVYVIAKNLFTPNGVAFRDGSLYIAEISRVLRLDNIEQNLKNPPAPVVVTDKFPDKTHHGWKFIRFGPDGDLYVPVGAPCNVCASKDPRFASIMRMKPDGSNLELYAGGIRNTVGFDWHPITKKLWFTDNGRDWLTDNLPPDELNYAPQKGMHFGFPYRYGNNVPDPEFGNKKPDGVFTAPAICLGPHVAALGMRFYTGKMFPKNYVNQIFIAEHGSWNRATKIGYRVMLVELENGVAKSYKPFAEGWLQPGEKVSGRPVDVQVMPDGALLVSDDLSGAIYRITYSKPSK